MTSRIKLQPEVHRFTWSTVNCKPHPGIDPDEKKEMKIIGAGDLQGRFYLDEITRWHGIFPNLRITYVDILARLTEKGRERIGALTSAFEQRGININFIQPDTLFRRMDAGTEAVDCAIISSPPNTHFNYLRELLNRDVKVVVPEKPVVLPEEYDELIKLDKQFPGRILPADFFAGGESLNWSIREGLLEQIGAIKRIEGECLEKYKIEPWRWWLMLPKISGGGVGGIDMVVHPKAMKEIALHSKDLTLKNAKVKAAMLFSYEDPKERKKQPDRPESFFWSKLELGDIEVVNTAGKGTNKYSYGIKFYGENGNLTISSGTEEFHPFALLELHSKKPKLFIFPKGVGYKIIFKNIMNAMYGYSWAVEPGQEVWFRAASEAVRLVRDSYKLANGKIHPVEFGTIPDSIPCNNITNIEVNPFGLVTAIKGGRKKI